MSDVTHYRLSDLNRFDKLELEKNPLFDLTPIELAPGRQGEPVLFTAVVVVTAISALAAFLLKKNRGKTFEEEIEVILADGTTIRRRVRYKESSSEAPDAEIIRQIRGDV